MIDAFLNFCGVVWKGPLEMRMIHEVHIHLLNFFERLLIYALGTTEQQKFHCWKFALVRTQMSEIYSEMFDIYLDNFSKNTDSTYIRKRTYTLFFILPGCTFSVIPSCFLYCEIVTLNGPPT